MLITKKVLSLHSQMPNGVIGNTTDSGSVKSRFEPWLGNFDYTKNNYEENAY